MTATRRALVAIVIAALGLSGLAASPAAAQERTGDENLAVAINTQDGATVFRLAFTIRRVHNGTVDQTNAAVALASCTDCQTIALAFQVVLASGDVDTATPENLALAYNDQCVSCVTYASATQIVLGFDGPVRFTSDGWRRLTQLHATLRELEARAAELTLVELNAEVQAAKQELISILSEELLEVDQGVSDDPAASTASSSSTTTTTDDGSTATTTTVDDETTTTTTTEAPTTTTTTTEETTTTTVAS